MMDNAIMAARLALLTFVTGMFVAIWSGDHPDLVTAIDRPTNLPRRKCDPNGEKHRETYQSPEFGNRMFAEPSASSLNERNAIPPLPVGITDGTYLVADQFGRTTVRVVSRSKSSPNSQVRTLERRDHFSIEIGNSRWHYIRVESFDGDQMAVAPTIVPVIR